MDSAEQEEEYDSGEEFTTTAQVLSKLREVWLNEKFAPDLLPFAGDVVDCMVDQINHMEDNLQRAGKPNDFRVIIHKMELERIRYILYSYLRIRVKKIEKFGAHLLKNRPNDMSPEERTFAQNHVSSIETYMHNVALQYMPSNMRSLDMAALGPKPNMDSFVFVKVNKPCFGVLLDDDPIQQTSSAIADNDTLDLEAGTQHIMRYQPVAPLIRKGDVQLI